MRMRTLIIIPVLLLLASCTPGKETVKSEESAEEMTELRRYEATFSPSDYNQNVEAIFNQAKEKIENEENPTISFPSKQQLEFVSGFRVQLISSSNIDEANQMKTAAEVLFPDEWFYLVYDAPSYKLRGGNFPNRFEADRFARMLSENGYKDAWVVPERVYKNPPPRTLPSPESSGRK